MRRQGSAQREGASLPLVAAQISRNRGGMFTPRCACGRKRGDGGAPWNWGLQRLDLPPIAAPCINPQSEVPRAAKTPATTLRDTR